MMMTPERTRIWHVAMLRRALALNVSPLQAVEEFLPLLGTTPQPITEGEAKKLARDFPFSAETILKVFASEIDESRDVTTATTGT